jgi:GxxExxY protein
VDSNIDLEDCRLLGQALSRRIVECAITVHRALGPGLLESAYRACLLRELELSELAAESEVPVSIEYRGTRLACAYRADIVVEGKVLIELKAVERLLPEHQSQVVTYLKLTKLRLGLLMNFHAPTLRQGLRRFVF